jgi:hypothetical protein
MALRTRTQDAAVCLKIESTAGTYEAPSTTTDMLEAAGGLVAPDNPQVIETNTFTGSIIDRRPEIGRVPIGLPLEVPLKATTVSGSVAAPEWEDWARINGFEPEAGAVITSGVVTAASVVNGRQTFTIDRSVDTTWPAADDAMIGRAVIIDIDGAGGGAADPPAHVIAYEVTGNNAVVTIAETPSGTVDTSSRVTAPAARRFVLNDDPPTASVDMYHEGRKWALNGAGSDGRLEMPSGGRWSMNGQILARLEGTNPTDVAVPADVTDQTVIKPRWKNGRALLGGVEIAVDTATVAVGAQRYQADNPNEVEAIEATCIVRMRPTVEMVPLVADLATRNAFADFRTNTTRDFVAATDLNAAAGARLSFVAPIIQFTNAAEQDRAGFIGESLSAVIDGTKRCVLTIW